jgi:hypothetical protein
MLGFCRAIAASCTDSEAEVRADKADMKDEARDAKSGAGSASRIPFWGWCDS